MSNPKPVACAVCESLPTVKMGVFVSHALVSCQIPEEWQNARVPVLAWNIYHAQIRAQLAAAGKMALDRMDWTVDKLAKANCAIPDHIKGDDLAKRIESALAEAEERGRSAGEEWMQDREAAKLVEAVELLHGARAALAPLVEALEPVAAMADALDDADGMPSLADELYCIGTMKGTTCFRKADAYRARTALAAHREAQKGGQDG